MTMLKNAQCVGKVTLSGIINSRQEIRNKILEDNIKIVITKSRCDKTVFIYDVFLQYDCQEIKYKI